MSSSFRAVVFDVGGVLEKVDPPEVWLQRTADRLSTTVTALERALQTIDGGDRSAVGLLPEAEFRARAAAALDLTEAQAAVFMQELWDWYCGELDHDLIAFVRELRPGYTTGILSNSGCS